MKKGLLIIATLLCFTACSFNKPVSECPDYRIYIYPSDTRETVIQSILEADPPTNTTPPNLLL